MCKCDEDPRLTKPPPAVQPLGYLHEITEPYKDTIRMFSSSDSNPWSHWIAAHADKCKYSCTPLYAALAAAPHKPPHEREPPHCPSCDCGAAPQAPIVKVEVVDGKIALAEFYTPGLPDGEHDLFCEPAAPQAQAPK